MDILKNTECKTDVFGEHAIWVWGKACPKYIDEYQRFLRKSPLGEYVNKLERKIRELELIKEENEL